MLMLLLCEPATARPSLPSQAGGYAIRSVQYISFYIYNCISLLLWQNNTQSGISLA